MIDSALLLMRAKPRPLTGESALRAVHIRFKLPRAWREHKFDFLYFIVVLLAVLLIGKVAQGHVQTISYTEFRELIDKDAVKDLVVSPTRITGTYVPSKEGEPENNFATVRVDAQIADELTQRHISFPDSRNLGSWENLLSWLLPSIRLHPGLDVPPAAHGLSSTTHRGHTVQTFQSLETALEAAQALGPDYYVIDRHGAQIWSSQRKLLRTEE